MIQPHRLAGVEPVTVPLATFSRQPKDIFDIKNPAEKEFFSLSAGNSFIRLSS